MERNKLTDYILLIGSVVFLSSGMLIASFPFLIFIGITPLLAIFHARHRGASRKILLLIKIHAVLLVTFLVWNSTYENPAIITWLLPIVYSTAILLAFIIFDFTDRYAKNRLGLFTILIYWLAIEYLMLQVNPEFSRFLLASAFNETTNLIAWNVYTGFLGVSLWILLINILLFYSTLKNNRISKGNINWVALAIAALFTTLPLLVDIEATAILREDLFNAAHARKQLSGSGEYVGKTAVWVSVLLLLFSFVKREVNK